MEKGARENLSREEGRGQESLTPASKDKVLHSPFHSFGCLSSRRAASSPAHKSRAGFSFKKARHWLCQGSPAACPTGHKSWVS